MRYLIALLFLTVPAVAADWTSYSNDRFGLRIDVPPGFVNDVVPPVNGDGLTFHDAGTGAELLIWGRTLTGSFKDDVVSRKESDQQEGWSISYERSKNLDAAGAGPSWLVYSGSKAGRILYAKSVATCHGSEAIYFRLEYPEASVVEFNPIVSRLAVSLRGGPSLTCAAG